MLLDKLTGSHLVKKFPAFYGTQNFITEFTNSHHMSQSPGRSNQPIPPTHFLKIHFSIIHLVLQIGLLPLRFHHQNPVCTSPLHHTSYLLLPVLFSLILLHIIPSILDYNYLPQYPITQHPQATLLSQCDRTISTIKLLVHHQTAVVYFSCTITITYVAADVTKVNNTDKSTVNTSQAVNSALVLDTCCNNSLSCVLVSGLKASVMSNCCIS